MINSFPFRIEITHDTKITTTSNQDKTWIVKIFHTELEVYEQHVFIDLVEALRYVLQEFVCGTMDII